MLDSLIFETALEVANPVGGICTVIRTKAPSMIKKTSRQSFIMLGMDMNPTDVTSCKEGEHPLIERAIAEFRSRYKIGCRLVRWNVDKDEYKDGEEPYDPFTVLFDPNSPDIWGPMKDAQYFIGSYYHFDFPLTPESVQPYQFNALRLGTVVHLFIRCVLQILDGEGSTREVILQSHEWCGSVGQLLLKHEEGGLPHRRYFHTVFTTHATILGRFLSAGGVDILSMMHGWLSDGQLFDMARDRQIIVEHSAEWNAVHTCDVFTTVSGITGREAETFLHRKPRVITINGTRSIPSIRPEMYFKSKEQLWTFVQQHFFGPSLRYMKKENMRYIMCCGRNEFTNKGFDVFIDALARLNARLKALQARQKKRLDLTIVGIIIAPQSVDPSGNPPPLGHFQYVRDKIKEGVQPEDLERSELPPVVTHHLANGYKEEIVNMSVRANLLNHPLDPVKFIWFPHFMPLPGVIETSISNLYYGIDLGVFPSKYEPWGYTPPECLEKGVPAISTNLAGSGNYFESTEMIPDGWRQSSTGVCVLDRQNASYEEVVTRCCDSMYDFLTMTEPEINPLRQTCLESAKTLHWDHVVDNYLLAYRVALGEEPDAGGEH